MESALPIIYLARHGETAWSLSGQHTGLTDLPLTARGEANAQRLADRLASISFGRVFTSPLQRARRTCELAGFGQRAEADPDLVEWDYGAYEGRSTIEIRATRPDWELFRDGCPGGETVDQVVARARRVLVRLRREGGNTLLFSSGHFMRVLGGCWLDADVPATARGLALATAGLCALGYEHDFDHPVIRLWNETNHTEA